MNEAEEVNAFMPNIEALKDFCYKAVDWKIKVEAALGGDQWPTLAGLETLLTKAKGIPVRLDDVPRVSKSHHLSPPPPRTRSQSLPLLSVWKGMACTRSQSLPPPLRVERDGPYPLSVTPPPLRVERDGPYPLSVTPPPLRMERDGPYPLSVTPPPLGVELGFGKG